MYFHIHMYMYLGRTNLEGYFKLLKELDVLLLQTVGEGMVPEQMRHLHDSCSDMYSDMYSDIV